MRHGFSEVFKWLSLVTMSALSLGLMFGACASNSGPSNSRESVRPPHEPVNQTRDARTAITVEELVKLSGNPCDSSLVNSQCMNDEDDIKFIPDCDAGDYHAVVSKRAGTALLNAVPPRDTTRVAMLAHDKVVCVQGIARIGAYAAYLFVTTDANITLGSKKCEQVAPGRFEGGCAMGWVDRDDMKLLGNTK